MSCFINKDDVAVFSCQFKNQFFCDDLAFPANQIDAYDKNAVKAQLRDGRNAAFFKVFTKEHAETGRLSGRSGRRSGSVTRGNPRIDQ